MMYSPGAKVTSEFPSMSIPAAIDARLSVSVLLLMGA
jgi:hypothetical protein